jgi:hypothetical protein
MSRFKLPLYYIFGARPVKFIPTEDGGMDILAFNWNTGEFERDMSYLSKLFKYSPDNYEITEEEFKSYVKKLLEKIRMKEKSEK